VKTRFFTLAALIVFCTSLPALAQGGGVDPALLAGLEARPIGPAGMSGRIADIEAVVAEPTTIYVGTASGGVWKSTDDGLTWAPIFDEEPVASIGDVAIFQPSPDLVWVGTGEGNPRNSISVGGGIFRSLDGGRTWEHKGLEETRHIHRVVLHPSDPETLWVAALGEVWSESPERGIFKTTDGGETWRKVLYVDEKTGAADLVIDPRNPQKLLAATWDFRRQPWSFRSGGPGSGVYLSYDGGENWKRLGTDEGFPAGELGRIGLAISRSDPEIVYALVEAEESAMLRSTDGGESWQTVLSGPKVAPRPFYYADIRVDPAWPHRVYSLWSLVSVSNDGGKSFEPLVKWPPIHPDHHAMWIHPEDPEHVLLGNDGGVAISRDRGQTWRFVTNLPLGQFYHVAVDDAVPFNVYGGLQDNGSWRGPSDVWEGGGIRNHHWRFLAFGDGFDTRPDPVLEDVGYAMAQEGYLVRWHLQTGETLEIRPLHPEGEELRFNWNAGLALDPFEPGTIYYGSQYLHRSRDRGDTWEIVSPDLTTDNEEWQKQDESGGLTLDVTGAENFTSIVAVAPSPLERGMIWVGTDDGRLHLTRDGGETWESQEDRLAGVPANTWIPHVEPSPHDAEAAFLVADDHRRGNLEPYVYATADGGAAWRRLPTDGVEGYALVIEQDPVDPDLLYLGTEFGLWISIDGGESWWQYRHGLPTASVMDLALHPRDHALVIATHGRSIYVLDDVRPLRGLDDEVMAAQLHVFEPPPAQQYRGRSIRGELAPGHAVYSGQSKPYGAMISFVANGEGLPHPDPDVEKARKEKSDEEAPKVEIEILESGGESVRTFEVEAHRGLNRVTWDLRRDAFRQIQREPAWWYGDPKGPEMPPGDYEAVVRFGEDEVRHPLRVEQDPATSYTPEEMAERWRLILRAGELQEAATHASEQIDATRADVALVLAKVELAEKQAGIEEGDESPYEAVRESADELRQSLAEVETHVRQPADAKGIPADDDAISRIGFTMNRLTATWGAPTPSDRAQLEQVEAQLREALSEVNLVLGEGVAIFRAEVEKAGLELLPAGGAIELPPDPP